MRTEYTRTISSQSKLLAKVMLIALTIFSLGGTTIRTAQGAEKSDPEIQITSPNGGESYQYGSTIHIKWNQRNVDTITIGLKSCDSCMNWIAFNVPVDINASTGYFNWTIPQGTTQLNTYKIWIIGYHTGFGSKVDESDGAFTVVRSFVSASLSATTPASGTIQPGQQDVDFAHIKLSTNIQNATLSTLAVRVYPEAQARSVSNIRVYVGNTLLGTAKALDEYTGAGNITFVTRLGIPANSSVELIVKADVDYATGSLQLGLHGGQARCDTETVSIFGLPLVGNPMTISKR